MLVLKQMVAKSIKNYPSKDLASTESSIIPQWLL